MNNKNILPSLTNNLQNNTIMHQTGHLILGPATTIANNNIIINSIFITNRKKVVILNSRVLTQQILIIKNVTNSIISHLILRVVVDLLEDRKDVINQIRGTIDLRKDMCSSIRMKEMVPMQILLQLGRKLGKYLLIMVSIREVEMLGNLIL